MSGKFKSVSTLSGLVVVVALPMMISAADARPSTKSYTCSGVKAFVRSKGAVVMNHKSSSLYRRFVASRSYCIDRGANTRAFSVPTKSGSCTLRICDPIQRKIFGFDDPIRPRSLN